MSLIAVTQVEARLREELNRVNHYLDQSTEPKIREVVERELISVHMQRLVEVCGCILLFVLFVRALIALQMEGSGLVTMLRDDKYEGMGALLYVCV